jgi:DNA-binding response OmpR family regulator
MLTARGEVEEKVSALDSGANDYVTKPFSFDELAARVRAHLRSPDQGRATELAVADLKLDFLTRRVERGAVPITLSAREFELLRLLAENAGRVVTRRKLFDSVWGPDFYGDERALDVYIRLLRKKIEPDPEQPKHILSEPGVGYRFSD